MHRIMRSEHERCTAAAYNPSRLSSPRRWLWTSRCHLSADNGAALGQTVANTVRHQLEAAQIGPEVRVVNGTAVDAAHWHQMRPMSPNVRHQMAAAWMHVHVSLHSFTKGHRSAMLLEDDVILATDAARPPLPHPCLAGFRTRQTGRTSARRSSHASATRSGVAHVLRGMRRAITQR